MNNNIKKLRYKKNMSQERLAEIIGTTQSHIGLIELKPIDNLYYITAWRIAMALGVSMEDLGGEE